MILAVKTSLTVEELKQRRFCQEMTYWKSIPQIMWHYFIVEALFFTDKVVEELKNDRTIQEFNLDQEGMVPKVVEIVPTNANFHNQWGFRNIGQYGGYPGEDARITKAWAKEKGSFDIIVAVIDSGIDVDHECLLGHMYIDPTETITVGIDADGNGYKNDFIGWNTQTNNYKSYTSSHGTAVASVITTNGNGMSGVAWKTRIMPVAIGDINEYDIPSVNFGFPCGNQLPWDDAYDSYYKAFPTANIASALVYAARKGAHIISLAYSLRSTHKIGCCGTYPYTNYMPDVRDALKFAGRQGCIVVSSAGDWGPALHTRFNEPSQGFNIYSEDCGGQSGAISINADRNCFPGSYTRYYDFMINVTAHDNWGYLYSEKVITSSGPAGYGGWMRGCNYGAGTVDIAAPGKDILVAMPGNQYGLAGGTSVASAFVAGAASLIWSKNSYLTNSEVVGILKGSARKSTYWGTRVACSGVLDVNTALDMA
jgi:subtilisin family serine protease